MSGVWLWTAVVALGGAGSLLRLVVDERVRRHRPAAFPLGIFTVNVSAALLIGAITGAGLSRDAAWLASTAFVGAYSTFSTWMLDTVNAASRRLFLIATSNIAASTVLGISAAWLGRSIAAHL